MKTALKQDFRKKRTMQMMNEEIYEALEQEFSRNRVDEEVEDVLLYLAEGLAEKGVLDKETSFSENYGRVKITAVGICTEEEGEVNVRILTVLVGKKEFEIDDYFL